MNFNDSNLKSFAEVYFKALGTSKFYKMENARSARKISLIDMLSSLDNKKAHQLNGKLVKKNK